MKKRWKAGLAALVLLTAAVGGFCYINQNLRPVLRGLASARVEAIAARAINDAIMEIVAEESGELIRVYENDTRVYLLQADGGKLNAMAAACANAAQQRIVRLLENKAVPSHVRHFLPAR